MIRPFNLLLRKLFQKKLGMPADQVGFDPPDENWRKYVDGLSYVDGLPDWLQRRALNIYLADLRENRGLRTNEGLRQVQDNEAWESPAPRWLDCHYLITAWDPAAPDIARGVEPTLAEHAILSAAAGCLLELETERLTPSEVFSPDPLPADYPPALAGASLPVTILPAEGFAKLAEFWGSMGTGYRWKPAVYLVATLPLIKSTVLTDSPVAYLVTGAGHIQEIKEKKTERTEPYLLQSTGNMPDEGGNK